MVKILAHRGFSGSFPENTMLAFKKAVEAGADGIENDVQMTSDGVLCVIHDETVNRTSDSKGCIRDMTWEQVKKIDVSCKVDDGYFGFNGIPTMEEYLDFAKKAGIVTNVEIKNSKIYYPNIAEKLIDMIKSFGMEDKIIISSFNNPSVMKCKRLAPEIECGFLVGGAGIDYAGLYCKEMGVEYYHPEFKSVDKTTVRDCRENGIGINVWTVNEKAAVRNMINLGVNAVITNYPDYALEVRKELSK